MGGVIGDDGVEGIQIGELGAGRAFEDLQWYLKNLCLRGIILCICSKNNEKTAKAPFLEHPEMVLKLDDISLFVANWNDKVSNIQYIQKTLNIGMDSIVFLDDNPFERNHVRTMLPEIVVPELPEDPSLYLEYIKSMNLFETVSYSKEDKNRTKQYQAEIKRNETQKNFESYDEYLKSLNMEAIVSPFQPHYLPRIAQLTQRSNQFNLRTIRYTEEDLSRIINNDKYRTIQFVLSDKFGDHGLVALVIMNKQDEKTMFIENWLMSCRVLNRGMEDFVVNEIIDSARKFGAEKVTGEYIKTSKNAMVEQIYKKYGFEKVGENTYSIALDDYIKKHNFISKIEE